MTTVDERVHRLVWLFRDGTLTEAAFLDALADQVTQNDFDEVIRRLPKDIAEMVRDWVRSFPAPGQREVIRPLPAKVEMSFRQWLAQNP